MKASFFIMLILLSTSCSKQGSQSSSSGSALISNGLTVQEVQQQEVSALNQYLNQDGQYQLTRDEYETLLAQGLLTDSEKQELAKLFE